MLKRRFDKMLTHGTGSQLLLLLVVVGLFFVFFRLIALACGWNYGWQDIMALFLDPGGFGGAGEHDGFRLIVTLVGVLLFSTLLISLFNNIFDNISNSAKVGFTRYRVKNHILIIGDGPHLLPMLEALYEEHPRQDIVIMTKNDVEKLNNIIDSRFSDSKFMNHLLFYRGAWDTLEELKTARPQFADKIYIIGDGDSDNDAPNVRCFNLLKTICADARQPIQCFVMTENGATIDMFMKAKESLSTDKLKIDLLNAREYAAEQILSWNTGFLPVIKEDDPRYSHFVILGIGSMTKAVAFIVAHNSHYSRIQGKIRRTRITIIGKGMRAWMDNLVASRPGLFERSHYSYSGIDGITETHRPQDDFLDIEWEFIDASDSSPMARRLLEEWANDHDRQVMRIALCHENQQERVASMLHLPKVVFNKERPVPICIYLKENDETLMQAIASHEYGIVKPFGPATGSLSDPLFKMRSERGRFINAIYLVGKKGISAFDYNDAWYNSTEADKFASTYCSNALAFRWINFNPFGDRAPLYEAEHRRWMMTKLLMNLDHSGIVAYDKVPQWKIDNFKNIIDCEIEELKGKQ